MDINARQIDALDFNYLDQQETYHYFSDQLVRAKSNQAILTIMSEQLTAWENSIQVFNEAYRRVSTTTQTKLVEKLDGERDSLQTGLQGMVNNALKSPIAAQSQAAEELTEPLKRYRVNVSGEYQSQTMRTDQLCTDLLTNFASQLATLNLTAWVEALQAKNQEFNEAMFARTNAQAGYVPSELTLLRQQMIAEYRKFVKLMNVVLIYEGDTAYAETIDQINAEVRHYKQIIARKSPSTSSQGSQGGTSTEQCGTSSEGGGTSTEQGGTSSEGGGTSTEQGGTSSEGGGTSTEQGGTSSEGGGSTDTGGDTPTGDGGGSSDNEESGPPPEGGGFGG